MRFGWPGVLFLQNGPTRSQVPRTASRQDGIRCFTKRTHRSLSALSPPQSERPTGARNVEFVVLQNEPTQPHARSAGPSRVEGFARQYSDFNLFGPGATLPMKMGDPRVERTHCGVRLQSDGIRIPKTMRTEPLGGDGLFCNLARFPEDVRERWHIALRRHLLVHQ